MGNSPNQSQPQKTENKPVPQRDNRGAENDVNQTTGTQPDRKDVKPGDASRTPKRDDKRPQP